MREAGKLADLSLALTGRFTGHHALLCRLHQDRIAGFAAAVAGLDERIAGKPRAGSARPACSRPFPASGTWWRRPGWARSAPPRTGTSPPARS
jgi:hypothetical protein